MRFDPAADPWGAAMLAAAGLWLLSLLVVLAAMLARTSRRTGGYLMLVSLLAFLVAAAGGTWERIRQAEELVAVAPPAPPDETVTNAAVEAGEVAASGGTRGETGETAETADVGSTGGPTSGASVGGAEPTGATSGATGDGATGDAATAGDAATGDADTGDAAGSTGVPDPDTGEDTGRDTDDPGQPEPAEPEPPEPAEPVVPEDLPQVDPLPTEPGDREKAILDILDDAKRAAGGGERCGNLQRVATAWARLRMVPVTRKAKSVAADLEQCRRRLLYSISQKRLGEMIEARDAWFEKLPTKLRKQHGLIVQTSMSGGSHERLRIGNRELDATRADALMDAGLRDELTRLQFAHVVISNGKKAKTYEITVTPEGELGLPWLRAVGLGEPLRLVAE